MQTTLTFLRLNARKILRYSGVSLIGVTLGQALLWLFFTQLEWNAEVSNLAAVAIGTVPGYLLNRAWVWGKTGAHSMANEVIPFWGMAFLGLVFSTVLVHYAEQRWDSWVLVNLANLVAFGTLWVAKFFVLERFLFAHDPPAVAAAPANTRT